MTVAFKILPKSRNFEKSGHTAWVVTKKNENIIDPIISALPLSFLFFSLSLSLIFFFLFFYFSFYLFHFCYCLSQVLPPSLSDFNYLETSVTRCSVTCLVLESLWKIAQWNRPPLPSCGPGWNPKHKIYSIFYLYT